MAGKFKYELGINEFKSTKDKIYRAVIAEFLGNFILNFFAVGACTQIQDGTFKALAFGLGVFMAIVIVGHVSGGHVNPAVTLGMLVVGKISVFKALLYIIAQCCGAIAGTASIKALLDEKYYNGLGHTSLAEHQTALQGLGFEFFLGLVLVLTVFGATDENKKDNHYTAPFAIGMSVTLGHLGTIRYTGSSMNPARTLGTAVITGVWDDHWIYWVGPILGGIAAALIYTQILQSKRDISDEYMPPADSEELKKFEKRHEYA
ncbi:aquaporin [Condylostylus longicornis]|uniref:aquaporin n=1 Tax=Condylostylus longicornis TaxID=2530218 RepID=UPI00244E0CD9|nr:aquaporin [Condylostylus longicornis]XP_055374952.1 aquaporin [Condylostylus longicornis]XP_055374957.1 aquaporin [Condylostylus longicornis]